MSAAFYDDEKQSWEEDFTFGDAVRGLVPMVAAHKKRLAICLILLLGGTAASLSWPWIVQRAIDGPLSEELAKSEEQRRFSGIALLGVAVLVLQIVAVILTYLQRVRLEVIGQDVMLSLREKLFAHILSLDIEFFDDNPVGRLMSRVESDTESLRLLFTNTVVLIVGDIFMILGIWAVMFVTEPRLALVVFLVFPFLLGLMWIFHRYTTPRFLEIRKRMADLTATVTELLHGMSIIQIFHRKKWAQKLVYDANKAKFSQQAPAEVAVMVFFNLLFFSESLKVGLVLLFGAKFGVTAGVIVLFVILVWKEFEPIARTADQLSSFQKGVSGARRIFSLLSIRPKLRDPEQPKEWARLERSIRFEHVWFSYTDDENWVLKDVSFEVPKGSSMALAGMTGGGKTTIISLLLRFYDPQKGRILVDEIDIREISRADLRRTFGLVLQDIILFPGSVSSNLALEDPNTSGAITIQAAETVNADTFIRRLPDGFETEVSEKGANFSRGERQLLSFARALVADPSVLVLDEATASVDPETERTVQKSLRLLMTGRTSIIIAHRLATILHVDQILVLRHGEIVERGRHEELIEENGYYGKLFALQFGGVSDDEGEAFSHAG